MTSFDRRQVFAVAGLSCLVGGATGCAAGRGTGAEPPAAGTSLGALSDLPLGESVVKDQVVLRRTSDTEVVALTAICTHSGCTVRAAGALLVCPCHRSEFDAVTGAVRQGPAQEALAPVAVRVEAGQVLTS